MIIKHLAHYQGGDERECRKTLSSLYLYIQCYAFRQLSHYGQMFKVSVHSANYC